jgi:hypothetical protein
MCRAIALLSIVSILTSPALVAAPLDQAKVTRIINDVKVVDPSSGDRPAHLDDTIRGEIGLRTGIKSRSELRFQDDTLTRIGPESYFSFRPGTREIDLKSGSLLLQVPKNLGGAKIHAAAVTASITGTTIMIEYQPKQSLKVLVLEGSLRLSTGGLMGDSLMLLPGKMVIMPPDAKRIPDPVTVDLKKVSNTSRLINMGAGKNHRGGSARLASAALIEREIEHQHRDRTEGRLIDTNLVIPGQGTNVLLASQSLLQTLDNHINAVEASSPSNPAQSGTPPPPPPPPPPPLGDVGPGPTIHQNGPGHSNTNETYGDPHHPVASPIVINTPQDFTQQGGIGNVQIESNDSVTVNTVMKVSDVAAGHGHGHGQIQIHSRKTSGSAISITSSAQLLALMAAGHGGGGKITFVSDGGDLSVNGATVEADRGNVQIQNNGAAGVIDLTNANIHGDVVKIGALGSNGTLNIGGGTISADSTIKLYAGGSNGTVNFTDNVTLSGTSAKTISGDTVYIVDGKIVTIIGTAPVNVFTNHPNYTGFGGNGSTTGTFGGQGAVTHPLHGGPGF